MSHTDALEGKFWATELRDLQDMTLRTWLYSQPAHLDQFVAYSGLTKRHAYNETPAVFQNNYVLVGLNVN